MNNLLIGFINELYKSMLTMWYFRTNTILRMFNMAFSFLGLMFVFYRGHIDQTGLSASLIAYSVWVYAFYVMADMSWNVIEEMYAGTLEQFYMSSVPTMLLWLCRTVSMLVIATINVLGIMLILKLVVGVALPLTPPVLITFTAIIPGLLGLGLCIGGLTLTTKRTEALVGLIYNALIYLSGAIVPLSYFPQVLQAWAKWAPGAPGIELIRLIIDKNLTSFDLITQRHIWIVIGHSTLLFIIGLLFFSWSEKRLKKNGNYGVY